MKAKALMILTASLVMQMGLYAQSPDLQVQVQKLPSNNEGSYTDSNTTPAVRGYNSSPSNLNTVSPGAPDYDNRPAYARQRPIESVEQTLSIIKPDAVKNKHIGEVISRFEKSGLHVAGIKMKTLTKDEAGRFYQAHRDRPFYPSLVDFMSSGPVVIMVLEGDQAIAKNRQMMGATDPAKADKGTLRADFAESMSRNAVHGSDSPTAAKEEIDFFFKPEELSRQY